MVFFFGFYRNINRRKRVSVYGNSIHEKVHYLKVSFNRLMLQLILLEVINNLIK